MLELFVAGTDTGVGKTILSAALLIRWRAMSLVARGIKPVETGCARDAAGRLVAADGELLARWSTGLAEITPFRFEPPVAPAVAARAAGARLEIADLAEAVARGSAGAEVALIEPAGGALSPIASDALGLDLAARLASPVLLVAKDTLGTQSHTLLAIEAIRRRGLALVGCALMRNEPRDGVELSLQDNLRTIEERSGARMFGPFPHVAGPDDEARALAMARAFESSGFAEAVLDVLRATGR
jgi:dethiobiotin synthetase